MTARIREFLAERQPASPCLVVDLEVVRENFLAYRRAMPSTAIYYAVKANPAPEILRLLADLGSHFDCASLAEIHMALAAGATPERISFGNTIKKERDIAAAYALGVRLFAADAEAETEKLGRSAPGARVFARVLCENDSAEWPLSRKFGCERAMAAALLLRARALGLTPCGVSFHVGSQQMDVDAWDAALADAAWVFKACERQGLTLNFVNLGGGFPARYLRDVPTAAAYADGIDRALKRRFGNRLPETAIEPGRGMVGDAGAIHAEVVLVSRKSDEPEAARWVFLDTGKFGGLAETMDEAIRYPIRTAHDGGATEPCILAGPTCDSADVLYEKTPYPLPTVLTAGDAILIESAGAYTSTYSANGFNGFAPLAVHVI